MILAKVKESWADLKCLEFSVEVSHQSKFTERTSFADHKKLLSVDVDLEKKL